MLLENVSVVVVAVVAVDKGTIVDVDRGAIVDEVVDEVTGGMGDVSVVAVVGPFDVEDVDCEVSVDPVEGVVTVEGVLDGGAVVDTVVTAVDVSVEVMVVVAEVVTVVVSVVATVAIVAIVVVIEVADEGVGFSVVVELVVGMLVVVET